MLIQSLIIILLPISVNAAEISEVPSRLETPWNSKNDSKYSTSPNNHDRRIFGGERAVLGQFPYQVLMSAVVHVNDTCCSVRCGGSLIDEFWVLTAAHCFPKSFHKVELKFGVVSTKWSVWDATVGKHNVYIHENYSKTLHENDIALVKIPAAGYGLLNHAHIGLIDLPGKDDNFDGMSATVSGFGQTEKGRSQELRFVDLQVMENSECSKIYSNVKILDSHVCGRTSTTTGMCLGDSGGPYAVVKNCRNILVGIVSFGTTDCQSGYPDVFTRVSNYLDWINEVMSSSSKLISSGKILFILMFILILM